MFKLRSSGLPSALGACSHDQIAIQGGRRRSIPQNGNRRLPGQSLDGRYNGFLRLAMAAGVRRARITISAVGSYT